MNLNHWENWNPADVECTEDRCVKGKCCPECNPEEYEQELEYLKEYTGDKE